MHDFAKALGLAAIAAYRRFVSPYKGFRCAYAAHTGHASCSRFGHRAVRMRGLVQGLIILRRRFERCGAAHRSFARSFPGTRNEAGFCDVDCGGCDIGLGICDILSVSGDCPSCGDCGWPSRSRREDPEFVYIPPARRSGAYDADT